VQVQGKKDAAPQPELGMTPIVMAMRIVGVLFAIAGSWIAASIETDWLLFR